jgi:hypothetical protein
VNLSAFHAWLRTACPATASLLIDELQIGHRAQPAEYAGLPRTSAELSDALRQLEIKGLVEKAGSEWRWKAEPKPEPQRSLFA